MADPSDVFDAAVAALDTQLLRRRRRVVAPLAGATLQADGRPLLAFAGNDYLGLAQHPALVEAAQRGAARYGVGATASPVICGPGHFPAASWRCMAPSLRAVKCSCRCTAWTAPR